MPFLFCAISLLLCALVVYGWPLLRRFRKKEGMPEKSFYIETGIDLAFGFGIGLVLALILTVCSGGLSVWSGLCLFALIDIIVYFLHLHTLFQKSEKPKINIRKTVFAGVLGLGLLLEVFALNHKAFGNYGTYQEVAPSSFVATNAKVEEGGASIELNAYVTVNAPEGGASNVRFNFAATQNCYLRVTVGYSVDGSHFTDVSSYDMDGNNVDFHLVPVPNFAGIKSYRFSFATGNHYAQTKTVLLRSVSFNAKPRVNFSLVRFSLYAAIASAAFYGPTLIEKLKKNHDVTRTPYFVLAGFAVASVLFATIAVFVQKDGLFTQYPIPSEQVAKMDTDIFTQLFDAFRKGQVHLDIEPDPKLVAMENPYDGAARTAAKVSYLWDHAFYGGKYYSYYGAVPVLLVSFPLYWLSGCTLVPNAFCLEIIGMAMLIPAFLWLILEIYRFICKKVSIPIYFFLAFMGLITSMMIAAITFKDGYYHEAIYHVPDIYGLMFFDLFLCFVLRAYRKHEGRLVELCLSGLCYVLVIASRPNLFVGVVIAVPFYLAMLLRKEFTWKQKTIQFGSLAGILLVGAAILCVYNKVRFDSILEFGQSYQLTVADQQHLTYSLDKFYPSFLHFFFQGPAFYDKFPYISCSIVRFSFDNCPYVQSYHGALLIPLFWGTLLLPFVFWKDGKAEIRAFSVLFPLFAIFFAYTTYSKAGICPRYLIELYHIMTIAGIFAIIKLGSMLREGKAFQPFVFGTGALVTFSAFQCLCLSFDVFDGMNTGDMGGFFLLMKSIFQSFHF